MEKLRYQPLFGNELRLLRLIPTQATLTCELIRANLDDASEYSALSYTWGDVIHSAPLLINHRQLPITENLHNALMYIRDGLKRLDRFLWVDAICINQQDLQEQSSQFQLMKSIYDGAKDVRIWLGEPDNDVAYELAVRKMSEFNVILRGSQTADPGDDLVAMTTISGDSRALLDVPGSDCYRAWLGIISIMMREWWRRTWIYQEATVPEHGGTKTLFFCGNLSFPWPYIAAAIAISTHLNTISHLDTAFLCNVIYGQAKALLVFKLDRESGLPLKILDLLQAFRRTYCSDPCDKIYAPLCLATDVPTGGITPDYSKTLEVTYIKLRDSRSPVSGMN